MNRIEDDLKSALRRKPAPPGFAAKVFERIESEALNREDSLGLYPVMGAGGIPKGSPGFCVGGPIDPGRRDAAWRESKFTGQYHIAVKSHHWHLGEIESHNLDGLLCAATREPDWKAPATGFAGVRAASLAWTGSQRTACSRRCGFQTRLCLRTLCGSRPWSF